MVMSTPQFDALVRRLIAYDEKTGVFTWREDYGRGRAGCVAGSKQSQGYWLVGIARRRVLGHHLAWFMVHNEWPAVQVDHRDLDRANNRIANLRPSSQSENMANSGVRSTNSSGFKGVNFIPSTGRWRATIMKDGRQIWLGTHATALEAHAAYMEAATDIFGEFARAA